MSNIPPINPNAFYRQPYAGYPPGAGVPPQTINPAQMATPPSAYSQFRAGMPPQGMMPQQQQQMQHQSSGSRKRSSQKQKSLPQGQFNEEGEDPSGDELDDISARDIAMARYKRNHDYLAEVFSPYPISAITGPALDLPLDKEELKQKLANEAEIEHLQAEHSARMHDLRASSSAFWDAARELRDCMTLDELARCQQHVEEVVSMRIQDSYGPVRVIALDLPGLEDDPPKDPLVSGIAGPVSGHDVTMTFGDGGFGVGMEATVVDGIGQHDEVGGVGGGYGAEGLDLAMALGNMVGMGGGVEGRVDGVDEEGGMSMMGIGMEDDPLDFLNEPDGA